MSVEGGMPLSGIRVVEYVVGPMAAVGRLLAQLGAELIRVEPPGGSADRRTGPLAAGVSIPFFAANLGKQIVEIDFASSHGLDAWASLVATCDILIEDSAPGSDRERQINVAGVHQIHPALTILSISNFGRDTDFTGWQATDPVIHALSGELSRSGLPGRPPLLPPGQIAYECAAAQAAYSVLLAHWNRLQTGKGARIDLSLLDGGYQALDPGFGSAGSANAGVPASALPRGRPDLGHQYPIIPCRDGFVRLCVLNPRQWDGMFKWMGEPEEFADPSFRLIHNRFASNTLLPAIGRLFAERTREELEAEGQRYGVPAGGVRTLAEALASEQVVARGAFKFIEIAPGVVLPFPDGIVEIDGVRAGCKTDDRATTLQPGSVVASPRPVLPTSKPHADGRAPLAGLRVLNLGVIVVGAEQARLLADQGADVVKVENAAFPDGSRQARDGSLISVNFAAGSRNQRSLSLNLRDPEGKALLLQLAKQADVLLSNFKPGTMAALGFDHRSLAAANPRLIVVDSSAFGSSGPWSGRMGYGPLVRAAAGLTACWSYAGDPTSFCDASTVYPDHVAARIGAIGVLALLIRRSRTGTGGTVSVSQSEVMMSHMATEAAASAAIAAGQSIEGDGPDAPWGVFPCAGDDEWCVVTVRDDDDWRLLCEVMDRADLAGDPGLADAPGRRMQRDAIDAALTQWLATHSPCEAMEILQRAGIPAGEMLRVSDLPKAAYYRQRGLFERLRHPLVPEPLLQEALPTWFDDKLPPKYRPAPLMGQHSTEVLREWLGLAAEDANRLLAENIIGEPPEEVLAGLHSAAEAN